MGIGMVLESVFSNNYKIVVKSFAQTTTTREPSEKKDVFKVIMTVQGLGHNRGDIVTIVSVLLIKLSLSSCLFPLLVRRLILAFE